MQKIVEVVAALIWRQDKFLICQRPVNKARTLLWEFVGGKVEENETKEQALVRECREELALTVEPHDVFAEVFHEYPDISIHLTVFNCSAFGEPQLLEHNALAWITKDEADCYEFCPADAPVLAQIRSQK